jgi:hypothetical protein
MPTVAVRPSREEFDSRRYHRPSAGPSAGPSSGRVSAEQAATASGRGAVLGPQPPPVEPPLKKFGPDTLEKYLAKKERKDIRRREKLNHSRVETLCHPFRIELRAIMNRRTNVIHEVNRIQDELKSILMLMPWLRRNRPHSSKRRNYLEQLQDMYMLERLQKQEEKMRLVDRIIELRKIIENIHRQYEIPLVEYSGAFGFNGGAGASNKTEKNKQKQKQKHKWSLKYKRSIDCKHPRGFSQRQHCKYGRKNVTKRR